MEIRKDADIDRLFITFQKVAESKRILQIAAGLGAKKKPYLTGVEMFVFIAVVQIIANHKTHEIPDKEDIGVFSVSELCGMQMANVSMTLDRLVNKGLLERKINTNDRRAVYFTITDEGFKMLDCLADDSVLLSHAYDLE